ncbi:MAG: nucleoside-diphosphate kinase [Planctomycetes bacterium]|nr:nucleoside-diphosphate kinase [Planctomycetota bacterium]
MERTLVLVKPDAIQRGLIGTIMSRFERKGLKLIALKFMKLDDALINKHYAHLVDKPFFPFIKAFMTSAPLIASVWEGLDCIEMVRRIAGITNARQAETGTIRGDFGVSVQKNLIHASDGPQAAKEEIARFFQPDELHAYDLFMTAVLYSGDELGG